MPPSGLSRHIANSRWSPDLLQALLERVYQTLRAAPAAAPQLLQIAGAVASAAASSVKVCRCHEYLGGWGNA